MDFERKNFTIDERKRFREYATLRPIYTAEGQFVNQLIWSNFYKTHYCCDDTFMMLTMGKYDDSPFMPLCRKEDIKAVFTEIKNHWNTVLQKPLTMYLLDQVFLDELMTIPSFRDEFEIIEARDTFDYIYDAEKLKTLSGRAYHKKKNHLNSFIKKYSGRYEYKSLDCSHMEEIAAFHKTWLADRDYDDKNGSIDSEEAGISIVFENCGLVNCKFGGVYLDGKLEAYSIGSYDPNIKSAFIHIEKANISIPGLYNYINQQFLLNTFPEAEIVNREDDLGQEGLRKAKLSYNPIRLEAKYHIKQISNI